MSLHSANSETSPTVQDGPSKPSALACTECRRKHVKCDAGSPQCMRCQTQGLRCRYEPSRRGLKRRKLHHFTSRSPGDLSTTGTSTDSTLRAGRREPEQIVWDSANPHNGLTDFPPSVDSNDYPWSEPSLGECLLQNNQTAEGETEPVEDDTLLINLFYKNFFPAHPFLVPRVLYTSQNYPTYMKLVIHLIGCHYTGTICSETMQGMADGALKKAWDRGERNFVLVQALLLFSMILHARCVYDRSRSSLSEAISLALGLNMHRKSFSTAHSTGSPVVEESIRRTWWELYITDGFIAALDHKPNFRFNSVKSDMPLPCEEFLYSGGPLFFDPSTLEQFESRIYTNEDLPFSSFAYRIEAAQLFARALSIASTHEVHRDQIQNVDNLLAAWQHHLGIGKAEPVDSTGSVDHTLLQAHVLIEYTTMYLHFPRSDLVGVIAAASGIKSSLDLLPTYSRSMHGIKAVEAAKRFIDLVGLESSALKHSPLMLNGLLLSCTIQLSASSLRPSRYSDQFHSRLCLSLGILKTLYPVWALAREVSDGIRSMANQALPREKDVGADSALSLVDSGINVSSLAEVDMAFSWMDFPPQLPAMSEQDEQNPGS
ncbi:Zn(2)-C6 fungal-type domain-containing protein [Fusarium sp. LHS14.1]|nr:Zn(2)-C6 fungal-type domain-containing protein [Fusarium sp. LHS14.1]